MMSVVRAAVARPESMNTGVAFVFFAFYGYEAFTPMQTVISQPRAPCVLLCVTAEVELLYLIWLPVTEESDGELPKC